MTRAVGGVIVDLDGTMYRGEERIPGAADAIARLRTGGVRVLFVTNNPARSASDYARRLTDLGVPTTPGEVLTSGDVTTGWLAQTHPGASVLVLGAPALKAQLADAGLLVVREEDADVVLASFDTAFDHVSWTIADRALRRGAVFLATHGDRSCPVAEGREIPDSGGIVAALEATSGRTLDAAFGKPSAHMVDAALARLGLAREQLLIVGDRLGTDIEMGHRHGIDAALVLTGVTRATDLPDPGDPGPLAVLSSIAELPELVGC